MQKAYAPPTKGLTVLFVLLLMGAFIPPLYRGYLSSPANATFVVQKQTKRLSEAVPLYKQGSVHQEGPISVHSPSLTSLRNGNLLAVWYGGSREGGRDVRIYRSIFNQKTGEWEKESPLTGPAETEADLARHIRKLGNPTLVTDATGKVWLFYVTVSVGGWSGGSINYRTSMDDGAHFGPAKRLVTTPFFNISTLVRTTPILYQDGTLGLPVYHELFGKFAELLRIGPDGTALDKIRISWGRSSLQPSIVPIDGIRGMAFLRYSGEETPKRILTSYTADGGQSWSPTEKLTFPNPNSSVMGLRLHDGTLLLVFNNSEKNRGDLSLAKSVDNGKQWKIVHTFESTTLSANENRELSYPSLIQAEDLTIHLLYSSNRKQIRHVAFNPAFLKNL
jgi:predicted neuraminidase